MKHPTLLTLFALTMVAAACTAAPTAAPVPTAPARLKTLRLEIPVDVELADLPRLIAADSLRDMGYTIEAVDLNDNALSVQALEQGSLDLGFVSNGIAWTAIQHGAKIITILDDSADIRTLIVQGNIQKCTDLAGKRVAVPSANSTQTLLLDRYIKITCPEIKYEQMFMSSQGVRLQGLVLDQLDGATLDLTNLLELKRKQQTDLHVLISFADQFPNLRGASQVTRRDLVEKYPETTKDIIRALLLARRKLQDKTELANAIQKYLKMDAANAADAADLYSKIRVWDLNGGFTPKVVQQNLDFFVETGGVQPGLKPTDVVDLAPLNQVLDEIGRK